MTARFLHDRFCKFNIPFVASEAIQVIRLISQIIPLEELKETDLSFKLNSLRWFLTPKGKIFLDQARKRYQLDQKLGKLDFNKSSPSIINQIVPELISAYNHKIDEQKFGEDREYVKQLKTVSEFLK